MHLIIGNKLYSSWSLRPWILLRALDISFEETLIPLDSEEFADRVPEFSGARKVPVLQDRDATIWESLAIIEYVADQYPQKGVWPNKRKARAHARAISAEMHAGFDALRAACPMNLGKRYARRDWGQDVKSDVRRVTALWAEARERFGRRHKSGEPFLYGPFCAADAMFAPVVTRLDTYDHKVSKDARRYMDAVLSHAAFVDWRQAALDEPWVVAADEVDFAPIEIVRRRQPEGAPQ